MRLYWFENMIGWTPEASKLADFRKKISYPKAERYKRRQINKRARAARKRNR